MSEQPGAWRETPSQTAGPFVHIGLIPHQAGFDIYERPFGHVIACPDVPGERIVIEGRVLDGLGASCTDVLVEAWQANADGLYGKPAHARADASVDPSFRGWGRAGTDFSTGLFRFDTVKPGPVAGCDGGPATAPHLTLWLVARGINIGLTTRLYFSDEVARNAADPVLNLVDPARRPTLIARREERLRGAAYVFDIRLQGEGETVFFDA